MSLQITPESGMWTACQSILTEHDERQSALSALNANDVISILEQSINNKKIQMDFIQSMLSTLKNNDAVPRKKKNHLRC